MNQTISSKFGSDLDMFARAEKQRHDLAMSQRDKIETRNRDETIEGLRFFFEEYEPRCYLFPVFEIVRRLFLSSVLTVLFPGSAQQVVIGLLGAMNSVEFLCSLRIF